MYLRSVDGPMTARLPPNAFVDGVKSSGNEQSWEGTGNILLDEQQFPKTSDEDVQISSEEYKIPMPV